MKKNNILTVFWAIAWACLYKTFHHGKFNAFLSCTEFYVQIEMKSEKGYSKMKYFKIK